MTRAALLSGFGDISKELETILGGLIVLPQEADPSRAADVEIGLGTNNGARVAAFLDKATRVRWYHSLGAGVENLVGLPAFRERGIVLTNNSGARQPQPHRHVEYLFSKFNHALHRTAAARDHDSR